LVGGRLSGRDHTVCVSVSWPLNSGLIGVQMQASQHTCYHTCPPLQYHIRIVLPHVPAITIPHSLRAITRARHYNTTFTSCYHTCPPLQYHIRLVLPHVPAISIPHSLRATTHARHYNTTFYSRYHTCPPLQYHILFVLPHVPAITIPHPLRAITPASEEYYVLQENTTFNTCANSYHVLRTTIRL
jgi:hypothetical protein